MKDNAVAMTVPKIANFRKLNKMTKVNIRKRRIKTTVKESAL